MEPLRIVRQLSREVSKLSFEPPVTHVYNPLDYAREPHDRYIERYANRGVDAILLGMNPGPWGMAQTGVPFGEIESVRGWLGLEGRVKRPKSEHPKRPIEGFDCKRSEVSGKRIWSWAAERFGTPEAFFERFFIWNYCPLCFMEEGGKNRTPDKLPAAEREPLFEACNRSLKRMVKALEPGRIIGVGKFAETRARDVLGDSIEIGTILHPSPASPIANRGWAPQAEKQLEAMGIALG